MTAAGAGRAIALSMSPRKGLTGAGALIRAAAPPTATVLTAVVLWEIGVRAFAVPIYVLPAPSAIAASLLGHMGIFASAFLVSLKLVVLGFGLSVLTGIPLGILLTRSKVFPRMVYPLLVISQTFPKHAIGPLFIVWFGYGETPQLLLAFLITFFPIMLNTATGLRAVRPETVLLARAIGFGRIRSFWRIELPQALPSIFSGLKVGSSLAVIGVLVAEFLGSTNGLGYLVVTAAGSLDTVLLFSALILIAALGLASYLAVVWVEVVTIGAGGTR